MQTCKSFLARVASIVGGAAPLLLALSVAGCGAAASARSSVKGTVFVAPTCSAPQRLGRDCSAPMAGAQVLLLDGNGHIVSTVATSPQGRYALAVGSGSYRVQVAVAQLTHCPTVPVTVSNGMGATVDIVCDSGLR